MSDLPLLPTTMVGSYPRPLWYRDQLEGRDVLEAWKVQAKEEAYVDAVRTVLTDQHDAGLDLVADGQMWFDDYGMGIGSFLWYWFERVHGFSPEKRPHPALDKAEGRDAWALAEAGGVAVIGPVERGPLRLRTLYEIAQRAASRPVKACVGAGPVQLSTMAHFEGGPIRNRYELSHALAGVFAEEIADLVDAGCRHVQLEDLGAWMPNLSGERDFAWVNEVVAATVGGVPEGVEVSWHFCLGNAWGNSLEGMTRGGYASVLHQYLEAPVHKYVLDFACRDMVDAHLLADLPADKGIAAGVIDVRSLEVEAPEQVAERIRTVLRHIDAERVTLTTDCGMKQLPRPCARQKLRALVEGAAIVRRELTGERA